MSLASLRGGPESSGAIPSDAGAVLSGKERGRVLTRHDRNVLRWPNIPKAGRTGHGVEGAGTGDGQEQPRVQVRVCCSP